jgi:hypothetical protein
MSDLCGAVAGMVTPKESMSTEGDTSSFGPTLQVLDIFYAVSVLVVAQPSSEFPEGRMNYLV